MILTWNNGDNGDVVKKVIENNFKVVSRHLSHNVLSLSTEEREMLTSDYISDKLMVYDTTAECWYQYDGNSWEELNEGTSTNQDSPGYVFEIIKSDWVDGTITIPYSIHLKSNPVIQLFMLNDEKITLVIGGCSIDEHYNIILSTDIPFDGKVVIK